MLNKSRPYLSYSPTEWANGKTFIIVMPGFDRIRLSVSVSEEYWQQAKEDNATLKHIISMLRPHYTRALALYKKHYENEK